MRTYSVPACGAFYNKILFIIKIFIKMCMKKKGQDPISEKKIDYTGPRGDLLSRKTGAYHVLQVL